MPGGKNCLKVTSKKLHSGLCHESISNKLEASQLLNDNTSLSVNLRKWNPSSSSEDSLVRNWNGTHEKIAKGAVASEKNCIANVRHPVIDAPDASFRMDALPNVSPDSGIISFEGSPFGNDSPVPVTGTENNNQEHYHSSLITSMDLQHSGVNKPTSVANCGKERSLSKISASKDSVDILDLTDRSAEAGSFLKNDNSTTRAASTKDITISREESAFKSNVEKDISMVVDNIIFVEHETFPTCNKPETNFSLTHTMGKSSTETTNKLSVDESDASKLDICSSEKDSPPEKTPAKKYGKKSLLLNHKKSYLYNVNGADTAPSKEDGQLRFEKIQEVENDTLLKSKSLPSSDQYCDSESCNLKVDEQASCESVIKKKASGRLKSSPGRKVGSILCKDNLKHAHDKPASKKLSFKQKKETGIKSINLKTIPAAEKRPRGRPRKLSVPPGDGKSVAADKAKVCRKKRSRKKMFTHTKKKTVNCILPKDNSKRQHNDIITQHNEASGLFKSFKCSSSENPPFLLNQAGCKPIFIPKMKSSIKRKDDENTDVMGTVNKDNSVFQDKDLDALLQSVKTSIKKQFKTDDDNNEAMNTLSFDNPFKSVQTPTFPHLTFSNEVRRASKIVKPRYKKSKIHVMMRQTKRKKKKKKIEPSRISAFGVYSPDKKLSFFSSCVQPPKILASSRLNVFQSGTGVENARATTPSESDQHEASERRIKKRHRLLNFKSKRKNILDPIFSADLDTMLSGLQGMSLSEDSNANFIKVRPGENLLPSIFRLIKIDVRNTKDKIFMSNAGNLEGSKLIKSKKDLSISDLSVPNFKPSNRSVRKKSISDSASDSRDQLSLSDASDQWLPPKKRHRMVNIESVLPQSAPSLGANELPQTVANKDSRLLVDKRKVRRPKKTNGFDTWSEGNFLLIFHTYHKQ